MTTPLWEDLARALDPGNERPRLRADTELGEHASRWAGREAIVHAPGTAYLRLTAAEADLVRRLDGDHTVAELAAHDFDEPDGLSVEEVVALVADLGEAGVLERRHLDVYAALHARLQTRGARLRQRVWRGLREQVVAIGHADEIAAVLYRRGGHLLFAGPVVALGAVLSCAGLVALVAADGSAPIVTKDLSGGNALVLFSMLLGVLLLHELGHALAVKRAGRNVVRAGFQLYLGHPAFFIDSTDLAFGTSRQRAVNAVAGPFVEASVAGLAALVASGTDLGIASDLDRFAALCYFNVGLNLIPFIELDGYWLLTDLLDTPRLRARSFALLRHELPARLRGRRPPFTRAEKAVAVFGVLGLAFTAGALAFAFAIWLPLAARLLSAAWDAGIVGRVAVVLIAATVVGPLVQLGLQAAKSIARVVGRVGADMRFRAETRWRVEAAEAIAALPHASELDDEELSALAGRVTRRRVRAGDAVVRQGEAADAFFVVRRGTFDVVERTADGVERLLRRAGAGDGFGEVALLDGRPRTATVRASADGEVFVLDAGAFARLLAPALGAPPLLPALGPALEVQALPPFRKLSLEAAAVVSERGDWINAPANTEVVTQGEPGDGFYVIVSGQAQVERDASIVAALRAGDHFGEVALLDGAARNATVRTTTPARLLRVDDTTFHALVASAVTRRVATPTARTIGSEFG